MANKSFDFGKLKRSFYPTKLKDGKTLVVEMPKKRTFEKMQIINDIDTDEAKSGEVYDEMLELLAEILSNNRGKEVVTLAVAHNLSHVAPHQVSKPALSVASSFVTLVFCTTPKSSLAV